MSSQDRDRPNQRQDEYLRRHLPPGASCGHEVLFDFDGVFHALAPTPEQLEACVRDLVPILAGVGEAHELYDDGHDATELVLALLWIARNQATPLPTGHAAAALLVELRRVGDASDGGDALKRILGIRELLEAAVAAAPAT